MELPVPNKLEQNENLAKLGSPPFWLGLRRGYYTSANKCYPILDSGKWRDVYTGKKVTLGFGPGADVSCA